MIPTLHTSQEATLAAAEQIAAALRHRGAIALSAGHSAVVVLPHSETTIAIHHDDVWSNTGQEHRTFRVRINACLTLRHQDTTTWTEDGPMFNSTGTLRALAALHFATCLT